MLCFLLFKKNIDSTTGLYGLYSLFSFNVTDFVFDVTNINLKNEELCVIKSFIVDRDTDRRWFRHARGTTHKEPRVSTSIFFVFVFEGG